MVVAGSVLHTMQCRQTSVRVVVWLGRCVVGKLCLSGLLAIQQWETQLFGVGSVAGSVLHTMPIRRVCVGVGD